MSIRILLFLAFVLFFYFALADQAIPKTYDIQPGAINKDTIIAPNQIVNDIATKQAIDAAAQRIQPIYMVVSMRNNDLIEDMFDKLELINDDTVINESEKATVYRREFSAFYTELAAGFISVSQTAGTYNELLLEKMKLQMAEQEYRIPEEAFFKFPRLSVEDLTEMKLVTMSIVTRLMADPLINAGPARDKVSEMVNGSQLSKKNTRELVQELARFAITPNKFLDETATKQAKEQAQLDMKPVYIEKNEVIVKQGEVITQELYDLLVELQLIKKGVDIWPRLGLLIMVGLFAFILYMFMKQSRQPSDLDNSQIIMLFLIFAVNVIIMKILALFHLLDFQYVGYLMPTAAGSILTTILFDASLAFISSFLFSILASILFNIEQGQLFDFRFGFAAAVVCFVSIFAIRNASQRSAILKEGLLISLFSSLSVLSVFLLGSKFVMKDLLEALIFSLSSGLLTAVLVIGLLPFFELTFSILSPLKLVELSNPNHVLLRKLLTETPDTYHHSIMVGNLAEAAAEAIGANGLLCRVGSFYHDFGKTKRPSFFIENQVNIENPHDHIEPKLSKSIIIAHTRDGVEMLKEQKMPKPICDIAEQHHGTTLLKFFYHKALKQQEDEGKNQVIAEQDYRYPGPKSQTKESAIVGIADGVEATIRSLRNPAIEQIDMIVRKVIKERVDDNQFNECDLTLKELDTIAKSLKETLFGIFHSRIEYPDEWPAKPAKGA